MAKQKAKTSKYNEYLKEYRKLAKRADQRLVRLEKYAAESDKYKNVKQYAYKKAQVDIHKWSGKGATRFNTKPPENTVSLKAKIRDIKDFLESPSSSIKPTKDNIKYDLDGNVIGGGIQLVYDKRADTLNKKFGEYLDTPFTWENVGDFFESALWKKLDKKFADSGSTIKAIGKIQQNKKKVLEALTDKKKANVHVDDMILDERVNHILRYYKKDLSKLLK